MCALREKDKPGRAQRSLFPEDCKMLKTSTFRHFAQRPGEKCGLDYKQPPMPNRPTILFSLAHPDDESFMVAGVSCKYGARGVRLVLATATLGDAGKMGDPPVCSREELPRVRESELRRAVDLLGIDSLHLLGYPDKKLSTADPGRIRGQLVRLLRRYRPALVITFDPSGFNLHPDHIAISRFTSDAIAAAADPRWLPEAGEPHRVTRLLWTPPLRPEEIGAGPPLGNRPGVDFLVDVQAWSARKAEALRAHRTQHLSINRIWFDRPDPERALWSEPFRQAWGPPLRSRPEADLFAGMEAGAGATPADSRVKTPSEAEVAGRSGSVLRDSPSACRGGNEDRQRHGYPTYSKRTNVAGGAA